MAVGIVRSDLDHRGQHQRRALRTQVSAVEVDENTHACLLDLAWSLAEIRTADELRLAAAETMMSVLGADQIVFNDVRLAEGTAAAYEYHGGRVRNVETVGQDLAEVLDDHPVIAHLAQPTSVSPVRLSDLVSGRQFERTRTYEALFEPQGLKHQLTLPLHLDRSLMVGSALSLNRATSDFDDDDLRTALGAQLVLSSLRAALDRLETPGSEHVREQLGLSAREIEILELLNLGMTAEAIGRAKRLAPNTVRKHLQNVYIKTGFHDRLQLVTYCRRQGLLPEPR